VGWGGGGVGGSRGLFLWQKTRRENYKNAWSRGQKKQLAHFLSWRKRVIAKERDVKTLCDREGPRIRRRGPRAAATGKKKSLEEKQGKETELEKFRNEGISEKRVEGESTAKT